jgi:hypothetical protein
MKKIYLLFLLVISFATGIAQTNTCVTITGNTTNGKFKQLWVDNRGLYSADTTQPEMGTAAWTCNAQGSPTCNFRSLFRYDVSSVPANAVITNAKLYLFAKTNNINGNYGNPTFGSNNTSLLQKVTNYWSVYGTGWANLPPTTTINQKTLPQSTSTTQNYVVDVTDFVQYWVNKPDSNYGMLLRLQTEDYYNSMIFHSGQGPDSLKPRLEICYTIVKPDSCTAAIKDSASSANAPYRLFTALPGHNNNKKPLQICWKFGDGKDTCLNYTTAQNNYTVAHQYAASGTFNVCVRIVFDGGCVAEACRSVQVVVPPPPPTCNNSLVIRGDRISGKFKQLWIDNRNAYAADTSQPEMGAAAWTCNAQGSPICNFRSAFRYDVSSLPTNAVITGAKLYLYAKTNNINGNYGNPTFGDNNTTLLQRITAPWNLGGTGWTNQPPATTVNQKILPQSTSSAQNYVIDVTDFVQSWVNQPDSNYGMLLRLQTESYYNSMIFNSGQAPDSLKPRLEICYTLTRPDSCKADFIDSTSSANSTNRLFIALPTHNNKKKPVRICWTFGDGKDTCINYDSAITYNYYPVTHHYAKAGSYKVCVIITYAGGCVADKCKTITVTEPPTNPVCNNLRVIRGNRTNGLFKQIWLDSNAPYAADTTQPEMGAAAWTCNAGGYPTCNFRSLFRYNVSGLPANAVITNAKLYLYAKTNNINGNYGNPTFGEHNTALLQKVTAPWNLAGTGWANQPATTTTSQKVLPQSSSTAQNYEVDVTDFVQSWVNKPDSNYGMLLRLQTESYYNSMIFNSGQAPESLQPRLEICYTIPNSGTDSCRANFGDSISDNNPLKKRFIASVWNSANKKPVQICWNFGDGKDTCINYTNANTPVDYQVMHLYATPGNYNICVIVKYDGGCKADKCRQITVFGAPVTTNCAGSTTLIVKGNRTNGKYKQLWIDSKYEFSSDSTQPEMGAAAWTCNAGGYPVCNFRSVFRYDLQAIPTNARITNARLYLYAKTNNINGNYGNPTYGSNNTTLLQQVITPWTTNGTGWNNQPATTTERQKQLPQSSSTRQNYMVDVSDFVQDWVRNPEKNFGMLLRMQTEQYYNSMIFNSGQAPDSLQPRLEVCYTTEKTDTSTVEVKLYSNPTTGPLMAYVYTSNGRTGSASLYDMQGNLKQVLKPSILYYPGVNAVPMQINRVRVPAGNYFVKIWVGDQLKTFKILVL